MTHRHSGDFNILNNRGLVDYNHYFGPDFGKAPELILDIGSGAARAAEAICSSPEHHATIVCFDPTYANLRDRPARQQTLTHLPAVAGEVSNLPFAHETFDRVVSSWVMAYFRRDVNTHNMYELMRVTRPGGSILIRAALPFFRPPKGIAEKVNRHTLLKTLFITKPKDFYQRDEDHQQETYKALARCVSVGF